MSENSSFILCLAARRPVSDYLRFEQPPPFTLIVVTKRLGFIKKGVTCLLSDGLVYNSLCDRPTKLLIFDSSAKLVASLTLTGVLDKSYFCSLVRKRTANKLFYLLRYSCFIVGYLINKKFSGYDDLTFLSFCFFFFRARLLGSARSSSLIRASSGLVMGSRVELPRIEDLLMDNIVSLSSATSSVKS